MEPHGPSTQALANPEPFGPQATESPQALQGIGIRIEDDVLVTNDGYRVLSEAIPSQIEEIEALVGRAV